MKGRGVADPELVTVEFYGIPRRRAGRAEVTVRAGTVAEVLLAAARVCPGIANLIEEQATRPHCLLSINGQRFVSDLQERLRPGDHVLLLSADVGG